MGKKKRRKKLAKKIDRWVDESDFTEQELMLAGVGLMAKAVEKGKKKAFKRAVKTGEKLAAVGLSVLESAEQQTEAAMPPSDEAVISYEGRGGGWYGVSVDGVLVDSVQGEEAAAERAAELLAAYAALDPAEQLSKATEIVHTGGGWYDIKVKGVPVARVRGKEVAEERFEEISAVA